MVKKIACKPSAYSPAYELQVTKENIPDALHSLIIDLMERYGPNLRDRLIAIAIGPNSYQALRLWAEEQCRFSYSEYEDCIRFRGYKIVAGPLPFPIPLFNTKGWFMAHEEAKRMNVALGAYDS